MLKEQIVGFALSPQQRRLWLLQQDADPTCRTHCTIRLKGAVDTEVLNRALLALVEKHEILRTTFSSLPGMSMPIQVIKDSVEATIHVHDLREIEQGDKSELLAGLYHNFAEVPIDIVSGPVLQAELVRTGDEEAYLFIGLPAWNADHATLKILTKELCSTYNVLSANGGVDDEEPLQYSVISEWLNELLTSDEAAISAEAWNQPGLLETLDVRLPSQNVAGENQKPQPAVHSFELKPEVVALIEAACVSCQTREELFLLAGWHALLFRLTDREASVVGLRTEGRNIEELTEAMGLIAKYVPTRCLLAKTTSLRQVLQQLSESVEEANKWHLYFSWKLSAKELEETADRFWPFCFEYDEETETHSAGSLTFKVINANVSFDRYNVKLSCKRRGASIAVEIWYDASVLGADLISCLADEYQALLASGASNPDKEIARLCVTSEAQRNRLLFDWNDTSRDFGPDSCLHHLIALQAQRSPLATAVIADLTTLSYQQLDAAANRLAHFLISLGVGPDSIVGLLMQRSADLPVALLAVLKAGAAYLPLDPSYPADRLHFMVTDSALDLVIADPGLAQPLADLPIRLIGFASHASQIAQHSSQPPPQRATPANAAYVIYTSGSTGLPKAVVNSHAAIVNRLLWMQDKFPLSPDDRVLQKTTFSFDASIWELFVPLMTGACVVLAKPEGHRDLHYLVETTQQQGITILQMVPSMLQLFLDEPDIERCASLRHVYCGGEALPTQLQEKFYQLLPHADLTNLYGPTESSIDATMWECSRSWRSTSSAVPIGKPISNVQVYILDAELQLCPVGMAGELYISGKGLVRGYLGRPDLTAERFLPHPASREAGARLYRTGDLARYLADGNIEFLGRLDHQVKVRGFRIELGEIESLLVQHPQVAEAVVLARGEKADKRLVAYLVGRDGARVEVSDLREHLKQRLPDYMLPSGFVYLDKMPVTANGKLDRAALPQDGEQEASGQGQYVAPRGPVEEMLASLWEQVLGVERIGIHDNFFELGGHSLLAMQVISRLREAFNVDLPLRALFESPSVAQMGARVQAQLRSGQPLELIPINKADRAVPLPLSYAQQRLWFLNELNPASPFYNVPAAVKLMGHLNVEALSQTINEVVRRHEVLRTVFVSEGGRPVQVIEPARPLRLEVADLEGEAQQQQQQVERQMRREADEPFDLAKGPLLRVKLLRLQTDEHVLLFTLHHIASDGWSTGVMIQEVGALYAAYSQSQPSPLPDLEIQYADYAVWQRQWLQGEVLDQQLAYWRSQLAGASALALPTDKPRPSLQSFSGAHESIVLDEKLTSQLRELSRSQGVTLYMVLLAAFQLLLHRYSGQTDISVGSPIAGRNRAELEPLIGFFVNTLVMRTDLSDDPSVRELLGRVREVGLGAYGHQEVPFEQLVDELQPERDLSRNPLFQVVFALQNKTHQVTQSLPELTIAETGVENASSKFDMTLLLEERDSILRGWLEYCTDLFERTTIIQMRDHLYRVLEWMVANPEQKLSKLSLLTDAERQQIVYDWNDTDRDFDHLSCIHELFSRQALRSPNAPAVFYENQCLSYRQLDLLSNQIANHLRSAGVRRGDFVALFLSRSAEMIAALLGVLKAGASYVPLDLSYPPARSEWILNSLRVPHLLTQSWHLPAIEEFTGSLTELSHVTCLDEGSTGVEVGNGVRWVCSNGEQLRQAPSSDPAAHVTSDDLAYVIFTSGSTGTPKGVLVQHRPVVNLIDWVSRTYGFGPQDRVMFVTSLCFDLSVFDVFGLLAAGASIQVIPDEDLREPRRLAERLRDEPVTFWDSAPAALQQVMAAMGEEQIRSGKLRLVFLSGDWVPVSLPDDVRGRKQGLRVVALGGATEATVWSNYYDVGEVRRDWASIPYGKPIQNSRYHIFDEGLNSTPVGVAGDLYIGGECLSVGYIGEAEMTAGKYIPDPYGRQAGARLYRTGDLARYLADGNIEFLGRLDHQVKVRGFRIELGEIESLLLEHEHVKEAVVLARGEKQDKRLVAYLVSRNGSKLEASQLREHLKQRLPDYMLPSSFVWLEQMPVTANGKLDRAALPQDGEQEAGRQGHYVAPRGPVEEVLAGVWSQVLGVERIGIHDNFFELGGHSLLAMQVISRLREAFNVDLPLRALFESPSVAQMGARVQAQLRSGQPLELIPINKADRAVPLPLSYAQQRLWFLNELNPASPFYNVPAAVKLMGHLNVEALTQAINEVVRRHEVLRTVFVSEGGRPVQVIEPARPLRLEVADLEGEAQQQQQQVERQMRREADEPFDLAKGPLLRVKLLRLQTDEHVLLFTLHHIASDGWSTGVMIQEVGALYAAYSQSQPSPLPDLEIQYADYAVWQRQWLQGEVLDQQLAYWRKQLAGASALALPTDKPRPPMQSFRGDRRFIRFDEELTSQLRELSRSQGVTLYMVLLAAFQLLLHRYSGQTDISVGSPIAGRNRAELEPLIGFFVNTLVMRTDLSDDPTVRELLGRVREVSLGAYGHQEVPFEQLVDELQPERDLSRNPLFQVVFLLNTALQNEVTLTGLSWTPLTIEATTAKFDIVLEMIDRGQHLEAVVAYDTDLFEGETIDRMLGHYQTLLEGMATNPTQWISELPLIRDAERQRLEEWSHGDATSHRDEVYS